MAEMEEDGIEPGNEAGTSGASRSSTAPAVNGSSETRRAPAWRKNAARAAIAVAIVAGGIVGFRMYLHARDHESTDDAFIEGSVIPISPSVSGHVARVHVVGNQFVQAGDLLVELVSDDYEAKFKAAEANLEAARAVHEANKIGIELTTVTTSSSQEEAAANRDASGAMIETARALASAAEDQREKARAQLESARAGRAEAQAEIDSVEARHERDAQDLKRVKDLFGQNVLSQADLDHASANERMSSAELAAARKKLDTQSAMIQQAEAGLKAAESNLREAQAVISARRAESQESEARLTATHSGSRQVAQSRARAAVSQAQIDRAAADLEQARLDLSHTKVFAPRAGYVTRKSVEEGAYVQPGQTLLAIVPRNVWVVANFRETQLGRIRPGQPVEISVDAFPGTTFRGHVDSVQSGTGSRFSLLPPENATGNFVKVVQRIPVKILFDDDDAFERYPLKLGMSAMPEVNVAAKPDMDARPTSGSAEVAAPDGESNAAVR